MAGSRGGGCFNHACPHFPTQVLEILKLREEEEEAHTLTISIYDTKRNEKSKEYREAMVSPAPWLPPDPSPTQGAEVDRDSGRKPFRGDEVIDTAVVLCCELTISLDHAPTRAQDTGQVPGYHLQELWPSLDLQLGASLEVVAWAGSTSEWALATGLSSLVPAHRAFTLP